MIDERSIDSLKEYDKNPHEGNDSQFQDLCNNLIEHGFIDPLIVNQDNVVIGGNKRLRAAKHLVSQGYKQFKKVPVWVYETKSEKHLAQAAILANNHFGGYSIDKLTELFTEMEISFDELEHMGFDEAFLADLEIKFDELELAGKGLDESKEDEIPEVDKTPVVKSGELWTLGKHRLLCGDCTVESNFKRLMDGKKADLCLTDPPYGMTNNKWDKIVDYNDFWNIVINYIPNELCICFSAQPFTSDLIMSNRGNYRCEMIWVKSHTTDFCNALHRPLRKHENIIIFCNKSMPYYPVIKDKNIDNIRPISNREYLNKNQSIKSSGKYRTIDIDKTYPTTVIECNSIVHNSSEKYDHPTQKPLELCSYLIENFSKLNDAIIDLFLGSGSTLIACEKTNRICYGMEIDPWYCTVILQRYLDYTKIMPTREDGITFDQAKNEVINHG